MSKRHRLVLIVVLTAFLASCQTWTEDRDSAHPGLDAMLWIKTSAEYYALAEQAYRLAQTQLDLALNPENTAWTAAIEQGDGYQGLPAAVVFDIDETILDTGSFQSQLVKERGRFREEAWTRWVREQRARAVPGAIEFVKYASARGVAIFYVTNRDSAHEEATRQNLKNLGFPIDADGANLLSVGERVEWESDKTSRRQSIAARHRIVLILGDDLNDFVVGSQTVPQQRIELAKRYRSYWGTRWIVIPNPVYGGWEQSLYDFDAELPGPRVLRRKLQALDESIDAEMPDLPDPR